MSTESSSTTVQEAQQLRTLGSTSCAYNRLYVVVKLHTATTVESSSLCSRRAAEYQKAASQEAKTQEVRQTRRKTQDSGVHGFNRL
jgi:uncharacterized protein YdbL (DUF1318 family)